MRRILSLAAVAGMVLLTASPAPAQQYPPAAPTVEVSDVTPVCGEPFTVSGSGFMAGSDVNIEFRGEVIATAQANEEGEFAVEIVIPCVPENLGEQILRVLGISAAGEPTVEEIRIEVLAAGVPGAVAVTGTNITVGLLILIGLLIVGGAAMTAGRRKTRTPR